MVEGGVGVMLNVDQVLMDSGVFFDDTYALVRPSQRLAILGRLFTQVVLYLPTGRQAVNFRR